MAGFTNRGKMRLLEWVFRGVAGPSNFYIALFTDATAPTADTNIKSELTEIASGNGYTTGGISLSRNSTDFDTLTESDGSDLGQVLLKDIVWTASGGNLPASGNGARYACLTDDNATQGSREILAFWDLGGSYQVGNGQPLTLQNFELRLSES